MVHSHSDSFSILFIYNVRRSSPIRRRSRFARRGCSPYPQDGYDSLRYALCLTIHCGLCFDTALTFCLGENVSGSILDRYVEYLHGGRKKLCWWNRDIPERAASVNGNGCDLLWHRKSRGSVMELGGHVGLYIMSKFVSNK